jgi:integrase/recombinase XerC
VDTFSHHARAVPEVHVPAVTLDDLIKSWLIDLRSRNLSPKTVTTYGGAAGRLEDALPERCRKDVAEITRAELRDCFANIAATRTPGGVSVDYRALQQFFKWADEIEEEITPNPMAKMRPPSVPESETRVLRPEEIKALRKACDGKDFTPQAQPKNVPARRANALPSWTGSRSALDGPT